jgi:RloB-like protein
MTEHLYFQGLKEYEKAQFTINKVSFLPDKPPAKGRKCTEILQEAKELITAYDFVFCILDNDTIINCEKNLINFEESLNELKSFCSNYGVDEDEKISVYTFPENLSNEFGDVKSKAIFILKNMPCLEFWYYLHFNYKTAVYNSCGKVKEDLISKKYLPKYDKTRDYYTRNKVYTTLRSNMPIAISNAMKINKQRNKEPGRKCSYSDLYFLFQFLGIGKE